MRLAGQFPSPGFRWLLERLFGRLLCGLGGLLCGLGGLLGIFGRSFWNFAGIRVGTFGFLGLLCCGLGLLGEVQGLLSGLFCGFLGCSLGLLCGLMGFLCSSEGFLGCLLRSFGSGRVLGFVVGSFLGGLLG